MLARLSLFFPLFLLGNALFASAATRHARRDLSAHNHAVTGNHHQFARSPAAMAFPAALEDTLKAELHKRQGSAPGAAVQAGTSNPKPATGDLNTFKVENPSAGNGKGVVSFSSLFQPDDKLNPELYLEGGISAFTAGNRLRARQEPETAPGAMVQKGTSNPVPAAGVLNNNDDSTPRKSTAGGGMTPFTNSNKRSIFAHPIPHRDQLNWAPHHLATRGSVAKGIELF
ncbi:hypothetical protein JCM11641_002638 [Rhodosporidiobolus odoratus]